MASLTDQLAEAQAAYHDLTIGKAVAEFRDSNGEIVKYSQARKSDLANYIADLKAQITPTTVSRAPMRVFL